MIVQCWELSLSAALKQTLNRSYFHREISRYTGISLSATVCIIYPRTFLWDRQINNPSRSPDLQPNPLWLQQNNMWRFTKGINVFSGLCTRLLPMIRVLFLTGLRYTAIRILLVKSVFTSVFTPDAVNERIMKMSYLSALIKRFWKYLINGSLVTCISDYRRYLDCWIDLLTTYRS
jgi:hypothetical protein